MNEFNFRILAVDFPKEERERIIKEHKEKMKWAQSLTKEEINFLCDAGFYNDAIKGYLITAAKNAGLDDICSVLEGTTAIAISPEDHTAAARILSKFADSHKNFSVKSGYLDGAVIDTATIDSLAKLPTREVLLATVCNAFNAPIASFARAIQAIVDKSGEAPAEEAPAEA